MDCVTKLLVIRERLLGVVFLHLMVLHVGEKPCIMTVGHGSELRGLVTEAEVRLLHFHAVFLEVLYHETVVVLSHGSRLSETFGAPAQVVGIRRAIFTLLGLLLTRILQMSLLRRIQFGLRWIYEDPEGLQVFVLLRYPSLAFLIAIGFLFF